MEIKKQVKRIVIIVAGIIITGLGILLFKDFIVLPIAQQVPAPTPTIEYGIITDSIAIFKDKVKACQTLPSIMYSNNVKKEKAAALIEKAKSFFDFRKLRAGNEYTAMVTNDEQKRLQCFVYEISDTNYIVFDFRDSLHVHHGSHEVRNRLSAASGLINSSLWSTMEKSGTDPNLAIAMAQIFQWTIDFYAIQKEDEFRVIYEDLSVSDESVGMGVIHAAWFRHAGKDYYAFRFDQGENVDYFNEKGENLRREFLKAPLKFTRISSRFSNSRLHPVLRIRRPHHGVDYAAPSGTPVHTIGNGTVVKAAYSGGAGRMVTIKHNATYTTSYLHLAGFAKGIRPGAHVSQGQVIGFVGSSGLSTGPHLDFRIYRNGKPIGPLSVESPPAYPVADLYRIQFDSVSGIYKRNLNLINIKVE